MAISYVRHIHYHPPNLKSQIVISSFHIPLSSVEIDLVFRFGISSLGIYEAAELEVANCDFKLLIVLRFQSWLYRSLDTLSSPAFSQNYKSPMLY